MTMINETLRKEFAENDQTFCGFLQVNEVIVPELDVILNTAKSYDELKQQLPQLVTERKSFIKHAENNLP